MSAVPELNDRPMFRMHVPAAPTSTRTRRRRNEHQSSPYWRAACTADLRPSTASLR